MSVIDQIMELEAQKQKLLDDAKKQLVKQAEKAVADLNNLGFNYRLIEGGTAPKQNTTSTRGRRMGVAQQVLDVLKAAPTGLPRAAVLEQMNADDDKAKQSISNALSNLKKKGLLNLSDDGIYTAA